MELSFRLRLATQEDIPSLNALIEPSARGLQAGDYTPAQIEDALGMVLGLDTQLIRDKTYFVAETKGSNDGEVQLEIGRRPNPFVGVSNPPLAD